MKVLSSLLSSLAIFSLLNSACSQSLQSKATVHRTEKPAALLEATSIITGADQTEEYLAYLKGKRVGMVVNPTSINGKTPSVDSLKALGVDIVKIFGPEHGFRRDASAGVKVYDSVGPKTGIEVVSLYGKNNKPTREQLQDIDLMIFHI